VSFFDDFLKTVPAADQEVLNRYPGLKTSTEQMERDIQILAPHAQKAIEWDKWSSGYTDEYGQRHPGNWDAQANMTVAERDLRAELAAAQARLNSGTGTRTDAADVVALRKELDAKVADIQKNAEKVLNDKVNGMNFFYEAVTRHAFDHQKEFRENLDPGKFREFIVKNNILDPDMAYDKMVADRRAEIAKTRATEQEAANKKALEEAEKRGYEKAAQERAMGPSGMSPTDQTGGIAGITAHVGSKAPTISDEEKAIIANAKLESGELARLGYKMFQRGDFGPVQ